MYEYLQIGKIVNTHGLKGEVKVMPLTDKLERFDDLKWVYIDKNGIIDKWKIDGVKYFKNTAILKFKGIDDINAAETLKGFFILVDRKNAVKLPEDSFFVCDIIGLTVYDEAGNDLGKLKDVLHTGSNDVYVVQKENSKELLLPALKSVVKKVSINEGKMIVSVPKGLLDDEV